MPSRDEALAAIRTLISYIGDDPSRAGLLDTPARVLRAWTTSWGSGYVDRLFEERPDEAASLIRVFDLSGASDASELTAAYSQMVVVSGVMVYSHCEHHMTPFFGTATLAYLPERGRVIGLSKLARVVDLFARRLQVQERLTEQVADFLEQHLSSAVGVSLECAHMCMMSRGVQQPNARTRTTALRGEFLEDAAVKMEFLAACGR